MKHIQIIIITLFLSNVVFSQKSLIYLAQNSDYYRAVELYNTQKYSAAQQFFQRIIENNPNKYSEIVVNSQYYYALCAVNLHNNDGEQLLEDFITQHPESPKINEAYLHLGNFYFHEKKYENSIFWLEKVDKYCLANDESAKYYFNLGYSYLMQTNYEKAKSAFFEIKDANTEYSAFATYYYAHIAYYEKNYQTSLEHFKKIQKNANFAMLVPYYITQLYYLQEKYDSLLLYAPSLLDTATPKRAPEIARMIGDSYYRTKKYKESIPYLEMFCKQATDVKREDIYQLGYAYYKANDFKNAIKPFESVVNVQDYLTQNTYYHLGNCYLQTGNKKHARNFFLSASKLDFDTAITEDALFNYAKISYELSINPYNDAITSIQNYLVKYPNSPKNDELNKYLVNIYMTTKNYKDALISIEKIKTKDTRMQEAYQKIAYYRGIELFNNRDFSSAIELFDKSLTYSLDKNLSLNSKFWKAESYYRLETPEFEKSINLHKNFLLLPGVFETPLYAAAHYNLGYCYFKQHDYKEANIWFQKLTKLQNIQQKNEKIYNDALIRIADCYFMLKNFQSALDYYTKVIDIGKINQDYALFQKAITQGVLGKTNDKIETLQKLLKIYSSPSFANKKKNYEDDAVFHLAETYLNNKDYENAYQYFSKITTDFTESSYYLPSLLKMGLLEYNNQQTNVALEIFEQIVNRYPGTAEFNEAIENVEKIYISDGNEEGFIKWAKKIAYDISKAKEDSITYQSAENIYINGDCKNAIQKFNNYLTKFEKGAFTINAHFYRAECAYRTGSPDTLEYALQDYLYVIKQPKNIFTERALLNAGNIYFSLKKYKEAAINYSMLEEVAEYPANIIEAQIGQMRSYYLLNNYEKAIENADKLLKAEKILDEILTEAHITIARSALSMNNLQLALKKFETTYKLAKNELKAEAKYNIAYIYYLQEDYEKSEKVIFEQINELPDYNYWLAKAFILLADNYVKMNNTFQAKHTLQSIIDHHKGEELVNLAKEKLNAILEKEKEKEKPQEKKIEEEVEISPIDTTQ